MAKEIMSDMQIKTLLFLISFLLLNTSLFSSPFGWEDEDPYEYGTGMEMGIGKIYGFKYAGCLGEIERNTRLGMGLGVMHIDWRNTDGKTLFLRSGNVNAFTYEFSFTPVTWSIGKDWEDDKYITDCDEKCKNKCEKYEERMEKYLKKTLKAKTEDEAKRYKNELDEIEKETKEKYGESIFPDIWGDVCSKKCCKNGIERYKSLGGLQVFYEKGLLSIFKTENYGLRIFLPYNFAISLGIERWTDFHKIKNENDSYDYIADRVRYLKVISIHWPAILNTRKIEWKKENE